MEPLHPVLRTTARARRGFPATDAAEVIRAVHRLVQHHLGEAVDLTCDIGDVVLPVAMRRRSFEQVLLNLVFHASDRLGGAGTIRLEASRLHSHRPLTPAPGESAGFVRVRVTDSGPALSEDEGQRLFEPATAANRESQGDPQGADSGMAVAYALVRGAGGVITVESGSGEAATSWNLVVPLAPADGWVSPESRQP